MNMPKLLKQIIFFLFAKRFVAGETIENAILKAKKLEKKKIGSVINILGEHIDDPNEAIQFKWQYIELLRRLAEEKIKDVNIAIKPSQLGLDISNDFYTEQITEILEKTQECLPFALVEIDREEYRYNEAVKKTCIELSKRFPNQRLACQANISTTHEELLELINAGISVRLCKGTAYQGNIISEKEIGETYLYYAHLLAKEGNCPAIATHDLCLLEKLLNETNNTEYQVLLGIENKEMEKLAKMGAKVRFYIPCGPNWYNYGKRRGKTIPKIFWRNWLYRHAK